MKSTKSIEEVIKLYGKDIKNKAWKAKDKCMCGDMEEDDIVEEVEIHLWKNLNKFDDKKSSLRTWVARVTDNKIVDLNRKRRAFSLSKNKISDNKLKKIKCKQKKLGLLAKYVRYRFTDRWSRLSKEEGKIFELKIRNLNFKTISKRVGFSEDKTRKVFQRTLKKLSK